MPEFWSAAVGVTAGVAAMVGAPVALGALGFGSAGVVAGSIAAGIQGPAVVSGSFFALAQSAGVAGLALGTKAALFVGGAAVGALGSSLK
ncbi:interferon alpha-inducible protein 27-like protein 2A [Mya arenaria]|uniref:interferon alpha-inducible protein 27-like protein 2A n=1 Tax=Mya arenaria TaxID=6604 RepID=UPI0022E545BA|nr:interferon alpha-inducible protein 27-like protein 2A [Mya arenaria]